MITSEQRQELVRRLAEQEQQIGAAKPRELWESARNADDLLHSLFLWDDEKAGALYRDDQARGYISSVRTEIRHESRVLSTFTYVRDPAAQPRTQGYVSVLSLRDDPDKARAAVVAEFVRVRALLERAREIARAVGLEGEVEELIDVVAGVRRRFEQPTATQ